eukprot:364560-Chlamydomonas_euryale.AAC.1
MAAPVHACQQQLMHAWQRKHMHGQEGAPTFNPNRQPLPPSHPLAIDPTFTTTQHIAPQERSPITAQKHPAHPAISLVSITHQRPSPSQAHAQGCSPITAQKHHGPQACCQQAVEHGKVAGEAASNRCHLVLMPLGTT